MVILDPAASPSAFIAGLAFSCADAAKPTKAVKARARIDFLKFIVVIV
jgi:hypothetical protein